MTSDPMTMKRKMRMSRSPQPLAESCLPSISIRLLRIFSSQLNNISGQFPLSTIQIMKLIIFGYQQEWEKPLFLNMLVKK
jgi:hypothetical protein